MCGISGFNWEDNSLIGQMNAAIKHRGPDDDGIRVGHGLSLGHVRLSIFDLSARGHQPMPNQDETIWIVYNGEIYNFREIRDDLKNKGYQFRSESDTEVIIYAYQEYGTAAFEKFNGIFAFALLDVKKDSLFLVRDRLGVKPLYYYADGKKLIFSSEMKALVPHHLELHKDELSLEEYLQTNNISSESFWREVKAVQPGTFLCLDLKKRHMLATHYCRIQDRVDAVRYKRNSQTSERQLVDELDKLLHEVVKDQLLSDAPLGTICSGGLDSSLLTAVAARYKKDLKIFNVKVTESLYDESPFAQRVADFLKLELTQAVLDKKKYLELYEQCVVQEELPLVHPNSVGIFLVSKKAREAGLSVLLSGEGADELLGGYHHHMAYKKRLILEQFPLLKFLKPRHDAYLDGKETPFSVYEQGYAAEPHFDKSYMKARWRSLGRFYRGYDVTANNRQRRLKTFIAHDLNYYLTQILRRTDRMSMAVGLEMRVPYLDNRLVDFSLNIPVKYQIKLLQSKYILKKVAERYLPKDIVYRSKKGFPLPVDQWLDGKNFQDVMLQAWERKNS